MLTKENFAKKLIYDFIENCQKYKEVYRDVNFEMDFKDLNKYVLQCTSLGIGLEYLGLLDDEYKDYIAERSGYFIISGPENIIKKDVSNSELSDDEKIERMSKCVLTVRDLLNLLPK